MALLRQRRRGQLRSLERPDLAPVAGLALETGRVIPMPSPAGAYGRVVYDGGLDLSRRSGIGQVLGPGGELRGPAEGATPVRPPLQKCSLDNWA